MRHPAQTWVLHQYLGGVSQEVDENNIKVTHPGK